MRDKNKNKSQDNAMRFWTVAQTIGSKKYSDKGQIMAAQIGFLSGLLGRYASTDIGIRRELEAFEQELGITQEP